MVMKQISVRTISALPNRKLWLVSVLLTLSLFAHAQSSHSSTGMGLIRGCDAASHFVIAKSRESTDVRLIYDEAYCQGLVTGVQAGIADTLTDPLKIASAKEHCSGWTIGQWILMVDKYLHDHPEKLNLTDVILVENAVDEACWPELLHASSPRK